MLKGQKIDPSTNFENSSLYLIQIVGEFFRFQGENADQSQHHMGAYFQGQKTCKAHGGLFSKGAYFRGGAYYSEFTVFVINYSNHSSV